MPLGVKVYPAARSVGASREKPAGRPGIFGTAVSGTRARLNRITGRRKTRSAVLRFILRHRGVRVVRHIPQDSRALHLIVFHQPAPNTVYQRADKESARWAHNPEKGSLRQRRPQKGMSSSVSAPTSNGGSSGGGAPWSLGSAPARVSSIFISRATISVVNRRIPSLSSHSRV